MTEKTNEFKIVKREEREREEALTISRQTVEELKKVNEAFEKQDISSKEYFESLGDVISNAINNLRDTVAEQPEIEVKTDRLENLLIESFQKYENTLIEIRDACTNIKPSDVINNIKPPDVNVPQAKITVNVDTAKIEALFRSEFPKIFKQFIDILPMEPMIDSELIEKKFDQVIELLTAIKDKKMPMFIGGGGGNSASTTTYSFQDHTGKPAQVVLNEAGQVPVDATVTIGDITVDSSPTFKVDPANAAEAPKFGKVDADGNLQADVLTLPITQPLTDTELRASDVPVSVSTLPLPTGAATEANQDPLEKYRISDIDKGVTYNYYGFSDVAGNWYILRETVAGTQYRYSSPVNQVPARTDYVDAWTKRADADADYSYLYEAF